MRCHLTTLSGSAILALCLQGALSAPIIEARASSEDMYNALLKIAPDSEECPMNVSQMEYCRTAKQAAQPILDSFTEWGLTNTNEKAAVVAVMAYESESFRYAVNLAHSTTGQGTRNMQSPEFNKKYATDIPWVNQVLGLDRTVNGPEPMNILNTLNGNDTTSFGSGAWFLAKNCDDKTRQQLQAGGEDGFKAYMVNCVQIGESGWDSQKEKRLPFYTSAVDEFTKHQI
ncbi:hypothetical protein KEM55_002490 [Ascosphaera atra]|nr:hypothetical protein KEM55_002490 [Ascosphaera atra]